MFGFNAGIVQRILGFPMWNSLRKNQLLAFYHELQHLLCGALRGTPGAYPTPNLAGKPGMHRDEYTDRFREYYFLPQFEAAQRELVDVHHYTYCADMVSMLAGSGLL